MTTTLIPLKALTAGTRTRSVFTRSQSNDLSRLRQSIEEDGLLYPLVVIKEGAKFLVVDGKKRLRVIKKLATLKRYSRSTTKIPCLVQHADNVVPIELNKPMLMTDSELAHAIILAAQNQVSHSSIAQRFECTLSIVEDCVSLTRLHPELLMHFNSSAISLEQAAAFATIDNIEAQLSLLLQLGPFVSDTAIIKAIKMGKTVIEIAEDNIVILPSRGRPNLKDRRMKKTLEFGNYRQANVSFELIAA